MSDPLAFLAARWDDDRAMLVAGGSCTCPEDLPRRPDCCDRLLDEIDHKARIAARHGPKPCPHGCCVFCAACAAAYYPCPDLRDMLAPHSGHPDFDPAWGDT